MDTNIAPLHSSTYTIDLESGVMPTATVNHSDEVAAEQMRREIASVKELLEAQVDVVSKDVQRSFADATRVQIGKDELYLEKFKSIDMRFQERDRSRTTYETGTEKTAQERYNAQAEAMRKTEEGFRNQIASIEKLVQDLKERMTRMETTELTSRENKHDLNVSTSTVIAIVGVVVAMFMAGIALYNANHTIAPLAPVSTLALNPTIGADTKRVDDMNSRLESMDRAWNERLTQLSTRLNQIDLSGRVPSSGGLSTNTRTPPPPP